MKKSFFILFVVSLLLQQTGLKAQELKYKNVYQSLLSNPSELVYQELLMFQKQDPTHANTYYQLALIAQKWAKDADILQDSKTSDFYLAESIRYFSEAKSRVDEKEARKQREYYVNVKPATGEKVLFTDIHLDIDSRLKELTTYWNQSKQIRSKFSSFLNCYEKASNEYFKITTKYPQKKDIYLIDGKDLKASLNFLLQMSDSAKENFKDYKSVLDSCPLAKYKQTVNLKPILTYGLDGFTKPNYFESNIQIWDFSNFVSEINLLKKTDIEQLILVSKQLDQTLSSKIKLAKDTTKKATEITPVLNNNDLQLIYKYDVFSLLATYLKLKSSNLHLFECFKLAIIQNKEHDNWAACNQKIFWLEDFLTEKKKNDSLMLALSSSLIETEYNKYTAFFDPKFSKLDGLKADVATDKKNMDLLMVSVLDKIRQHNIGLLTDEVTSSEQVDEKDGKISIKIITPDFSTIVYNTAQTYRIVEDLNGDKYVTGYFARTGKKSLAFICKLVRITEANNDTLKLAKKWNIAWQKNISLNPNFNECGAELKVTANNCYLLVNSSVQSGGKMINTLVKLDKLGNDLGHTILQDNEIPRALQVDELNERIVCAFKGKTFETKITDQAMLTVSAYRFTGDSLWRHKIELAGSVVDMIKAGSEYLVYCNFNKYTDLNGSEIITSGGSNTLLVNVIESGKRLTLKRFMSETPFFTTKAIKINNNKIALIGFKTDFLNVRNPDFKTDAQLYYSISTSEGLEIFNNLK